MANTIILDGLLDLTKSAIPPVEALLDTAKDAVRALVTVDGRVSGSRIEAHQSAAHGLAWLATYAASLRQMQGWASRLNDQGKFGEVEQLIQQIAFGE